MNELRRALAAVIDLASQMIDELDEETMLALADLLNAVSERLGELEDSPADGLPPNVPQESLTQAMPSSNVEGFAYDDKTGKLLVRFLGKYPNRNGPIYGYEGVPKQIFDLFQKGAVPARTNGKNKWGAWWKGKVPSIGASLYTLLKTQNYPYQRLS
jgi:hypothetical protein